MYRSCIEPPKCEFPFKLSKPYKNNKLKSLVAYLRLLSRALITKLYVVCVVFFDVQFYISFVTVIWELYHILIFEKSYQIRLALSIYSKYGKVLVSAWFSGCF